MEATGTHFMQFPDLIKTVNTADGVAILEHDRFTGKFFLCEPVTMEARECHVMSDPLPVADLHYTRDLWSRGRGSKMNFRLRCWLECHVTFSGFENTCVYENL